ncbi:MAG: hypothetical protein FWE40_10185 [Oscillospiraceae bacterium]|jgi:hypothetical protein|nr:hypothetical protein [Oscillospiraceae bacterium]
METKKEVHETCQSIDGTLYCVESILPERKALSNILLLAALHEVNLHNCANDNAMLYC